MEGFDHEPIDPIGLNYHFIRTWIRGAFFIYFTNTRAGSCIYPYIQIDKSKIYIFTGVVSTDSDGIKSYDHVLFWRIQIK